MNPGIRRSMALRRHRGFTLLELLIAAVVSMIAVSAMVILMGSTLGATTQTIELSRLTQEMRTGLQVMSRELRRANYHNNFLSCYGNADCLTDLGYTGQVREISITNATSANGPNDCFWFWYDRPQYCPGASCTQAEMAAVQTPVTGEFVAAFRRDTNADGVGTLQMTTSLTGPPNCNLDDNWVDITDPNLMDVLTFDVDDSGSVCENLGSGTDSQVVERVRLTLTARMAFDPSVRTWLQAQPNVTRTMTDFIRVRNNVTQGTACT